MNPVGLVVRDPVGGNVAVALREGPIVAGTPGRAGGPRLAVPDGLVRMTMFNCDGVSLRAEGGDRVVQRGEKHRRQEDPREEDVQAEVTDQTAASDSTVSSDADELLDEIDEVLKTQGLDTEAAAKSFVDGYVAKGGQ
ncbi:ubiquitin-like protein Pup [Streptomyces sp. NPDC016566]|uniref:ubiquitin-like protein Pup n=1 Tax=Streptomyces sp. NPDC016566 TaxID=3364967 RepID=UPI0037028D68